MYNIRHILELNDIQMHIAEEVLEHSVTLWIESLSVTIKDITNAILVDLLSYNKLKK